MASLKNDKTQGPCKPTARRLPLLRGDAFFGEGAQIHVCSVLETASESYRHAHDFLEVATVRSGTGVHRVGALSGRVSAGDVFVINRFEPHAYANTDRLEVTYLLLGLDEIETLKTRFGGVSEVRAFFFRDHSPSVCLQQRSSLRLGPEALNTIGQLLDTLQREAATPGVGRELLLGSLVMQMMIRVGREWERLVGPAPEPRATSQGAAERFTRRNSCPEAVERVLRYIESRYADDLRATDLARCSGFQVQYFARLFKRCIGVPPTEYLRRYRVARAIELLVDTDRTVTEIAHRTGFNDLAHFVRTFKNAVGSPPGAWRREVRKPQPKVTSIQVPNRSDCFTP